MPKKLKVFHGMVNYGTQAGLFARELRRNGVDAISVTNPDAFKRLTDIELLHGGNLTQKIFKHIWNYIRKFYWFFRYNTFHFYAGSTLFPNQVDLPFYNMFGKRVLMEHLGNDIRNYKWLVERCGLPESHMFYEKMEYNDRLVEKRIKNEKRYLNYSVACLPTHILYAKQYNYDINEVLPLCLEVDQIEFVPKSIVSGEVIKFLHAATSKSLKGTEIIENAIDELIREGYSIEYRFVENVTHEQLFEEYEYCNVFLSNIGLGWFGTSALEAMAVGRTTCAYIDEEYYDYIDYSDEIPVININKSTIGKVLKNLIKNRDKLPEIGLQSRRYVEKHHDIKNVTKILIDIYHNKVWDGKIKIK